MTAHNARYGWPHRRLRASVKRDVEAGIATCWRCTRPIAPGEQWDLGHVDGGGPRDYRGPEHRRCSRATVSHARENLRQAQVPRLPPTRIASRHWGGSDTYEEWCSECRRQGSACGTVRTTNKQEESP